MNLKTLTLIGIKLRSIAQMHKIIPLDYSLYHVFQQIWLLIDMTQGRQAVHIFILGSSRNLNSFIVLIPRDMRKFFAQKMVSVMPKTEIVDKIQSVFAVMV